MDTNYPNYKKIWLKILNDINIINMIHDGSIINGLYIFLGIKHVITKVITAVFKDINFLSTAGQL